MIGISIIIPILNEESNIRPLIERIQQAVSGLSIPYEIIFIDDHSTDHTKTVIEQYLPSYPIVLRTKKGKAGKAQSLLEGFAYARYNLLCMIDGDLQYPPEAIPSMIQKIIDGADVVVTERKIKTNSSGLRNFATQVHSYVFHKKMHNLHFDVQSGLKVFKKEVIERIRLNPKGWAFDLEFLLKVRNAGYKIESIDITFSKRNGGKTKVNILSTAMHLSASSIKQKLQRPDIVPFHPEMAKEKGNGFHYKGKEFVHHSSLHHSESAIHRLSGKQMFVLIVLAILMSVAFYLNWHDSIIILLAVLTFVYFVDLLFNFYLIYRSFSIPSEIEVSKEEVGAISDSEWPSYTVFCPLYKEWQVVPQFVAAMSKLEYPKEKLQVMLLLEEDDKETIEHIQKMNLPSFFDMVVVPHSFPKTKPKACNYGLQFATGEYVVIYDAEDVPDTQQLKKAVLAFAKAKENTICIQAKLNFYNPHQNILTRVFTAEYSLWFDLVLTGLQSINAPIPLGGTSNHFKTRDLFQLRGWDSFNVTEDCDLGMRLVKEGYSTAIVASETLEEANSGMMNWFWQRTRWIKGYMQTYLIHMRDPMKFSRNLKNPDMITFQLVVGGKILSMFINPFMWLITIAYFAFRSHIGLFIESFFPPVIFYMAVVSLILGNFLYMYYYMIGCAKHGHHELIKYVFFVPLYWLGMSMAAWVATYKLIVAPHHWSKTKHGLHLTDKKALKQSQEKIEEANSSTEVRNIPSMIPSYS